MSSSFAQETEIDVVITKGDYYTFLWIKANSSSSKIKILTTSSSSRKASYLKEVSETGMIRRYSPLEKQNKTNL